MKIEEQEETGLRISDTMNEEIMSMKIQTAARKTPKMMMAINIPRIVFMLIFIPKTRLNVKESATKALRHKA